EELGGDLFDECAADLAADLLTSVGDRERRLQDRLGARHVGGVAGRRRSEQGREHRSPAGWIDRLAVHHCPRKKALDGGRVGEQRRSASDLRIRLDAGVDDGPRIAGCILEPHGLAPTATRTTWGKVDSQSMARCGSWIRRISSIARSIAALASSEASSSPGRAATSSKRVRQVSVRSLTYDDSPSIPSPSSDSTS